jgi:hypothetical protein
LILLTSKYSFLQTAETVEAIVISLLEKQRLARQSVTSGDTLTLASGPSSNSSSSNQMVTSCGGGGTSGSTTTARLSSSSSTSSLIQMTNNGPSIGATVTTAPQQTHAPQIKTEAHQSQHQQTQLIGMNGGARMTAAVMTTNNGPHHSTQADRPFVFNLSQFQSSGGLIILNGKPTVTTPGAGVGVTQQNHTASVQTTHHSALAAVQNLK